MTVEQIALLLDVAASHEGLSVDVLRERLAHRRPSARAARLARLLRREPWPVHDLHRLEQMGLLLQVGDRWHPTDQGVQLAGACTHLQLLRLRPTW